MNALSSKNVIYVLNGGHWVMRNPPLNPTRENFLIRCRYGDWSGFRTLAACLTQIPSRDREDGFYWIEER